jgi:hypothetical protein
MRAEVRELWTGSEEDFLRRVREKARRSRAFDFAKERDIRPYLIIWY